MQSKVTKVSPCLPESAKDQRAVAAQLVGGRIDPVVGQVVGEGKTSAAGVANAHTRPHRRLPERLFYLTGLVVKIGGVLIRSFGVAGADRAGT